MPGCTSLLALHEVKLSIIPQVIPTVGVDGENADRNRRAMLKHFRNLVDETASKASFLAAFKRSDSARVEASGSLDNKAISGDAGMSEAAEDSASDADSEAASEMGEGNREPSGNPGPPDHEEETPKSESGKVTEGKALTATNPDGTRIWLCQVATLSSSAWLERWIKSMQYI